jgi:hypothetical protein
MPAYVDQGVLDFIDAPDGELISDLHKAYATDGFVSQYTSQTIAWEFSLNLIKTGLQSAIASGIDVTKWRVLLELPLYRLRRRVDFLLVTPQALAVIELKVGEDQFLSSDRWQVEEYALDLRDFHEFSHGIPILPVLWCTEAPGESLHLPVLRVGVADAVAKVGRGQFPRFVSGFASHIAALPRTVREDWGRGAYRPVPSVIEAATSLFAGHGVEEIARRDAANLEQAAESIVSLIRQARDRKRRFLIFLTGVPGSGKTLAGLQIVHRVHESEGRHSGDVVYLSGNTPLVTVLREALTEDEYRYRVQAGKKVKKDTVRSSVRARIQHIMDFLKEYLSDAEERAPHERAIVFDEAQRAWDAAYGKQKFGRSASEPRLLLDIMGRHDKWSAIVGLIGGGQEINTGENGMAEWGDALRSLAPESRSEWEIFGPPGMTNGDRASAFLGLGELQDMTITEVPDLTLAVPLRSYRSPRVADWVAAVLDADQSKAASIMLEIGDYPILLTRESHVAMDWLRSQGRGQRRFGLVASSAASRLRADGFGVSLNATDGRDIAYWYLKPRGDVRSSYALEVTANEYTTQGLELDFIGLCWGGDLLISGEQWTTRRFSGTFWKAANGDRRRFILNSYRVLLTRAREGMVIWVPRGDPSDTTRDPSGYDRTANFLSACGLRTIAS